MAKRKLKRETDPIPLGRRFFLNRVQDDSGVSGLGYVAFGIQLPSGKVVIEWVVGDHRSQESHESLGDCMAIHGHGDHTQVIWVDNIDVQIPRG